MKNWTVYLLGCSNGVSYFGCTDNLDEVVESHKRSGDIDGKTQVALVACRSQLSHQEAQQIVYRVKQGKLNRGDRLL